jgi:hypothetical protein
MISFFVDKFANKTLNSAQALLPQKCEDAELAKNRCVLHNCVCSVITAAALCVIGALAAQLAVLRAENAGTALQHVKALFLVADLAALAWVAHAGWSFHASQKPTFKLPS